MATDVMPPGWPAIMSQTESQVLRPVIVLHSHEAGRQRWKCLLADVMQPNTPIHVASRTTDVVDLLAQEDAGLVVINLPRTMTGFDEVLGLQLRLVRYLSRRHRPVATIMVGNPRQDGFRERCLESGAGAFLLDNGDDQPATLEGLKNSVRQALRRGSRLVWDHPGPVKLLWEGTEVILWEHGAVESFYESETLGSRSTLMEFLQAKARQVGQLGMAGAFEGMAAFGPENDVLFLEKDQKAMLAICRPETNSEPPPLEVRTLLASLFSVELVDEESQETAAQ